MTGNWYKQAIAAALAVSLMFPAAECASGRAAGSAAKTVNVVLDGYPLTFPAEPLIENGTTLVPFRALSEALGVKVNYDASERIITAVKTEPDGGKRTIILKPGSTQATVNGEPAALTAAPRIVNGHTYIPLSFFSRQYGAAVKWHGATRTAEIRSPKSAMYGMAFYALSSFSQRDDIPSFSSVAFGWSRLDDEGRFTLEGREYRWPQPAGDITPELIVTDAAAAGTAPYLMLYSGDAKLQLTGVLADEAKMEAVIDGLIRTAVTHSFEGVLLDLEGLGLTGDKLAVRQSYNAFVGRVSERTKEAGLKLAIAVHPLNGSYQGYDYAALGELADELIIMAYAYGNEKSPEPDDKVDEAIRLALRETTKDKLVLGISLASENAESVGVKIGLAKRYGLKGTAFWRLGLISEAEMAAIERTVDLRG